MFIETEKEMFITLDFSGTEKKFTNTGELTEFIGSQYSAWSWLEQVAREDDNLKQVWNPFIVYFDQVERFIRGYHMASVDTGTDTRQFNELKNQTEAAVNQGFILAEAPKARFILDLKDKNSPLTAGYALAYLNNKKIDANDPAAREGISIAVLYLLDPTVDSTEVQKEIRDSVKLAWSRKFESQYQDLEEKNIQLIERTVKLHEKSHLLAKKVKEQVAKLASDFENQITQQADAFENRWVEQAKRFKDQMTVQARDLKQQIKIQEGIFDNQIGKQKEDFASMFDDVRKKLTDFQVSFMDKIAMQESAEFWESKFSDHQRAMRIAISITMISAILTGGIFIWAASMFLDGDIYKIQLSEIGVMLVISTIGIWLTRLSAKIFISHLHLRTDAKERVTMFKTYFALLIEDRGLNDNDRQLILSTLFRPGSTGFIKDDGPTTIPDSVAKRFSQNP